MNSHSPLLTPEMTPPAEPGSSPVDVEYLAPLTIGILPSVVTFLGPLLVSDALPMFGYGIGIGPPGEGVLHTSGKTVLIPPLPLWAIPRELAKVVCPIAVSPYCGELTITAARSPPSDEQ